MLYCQATYSAFNPLKLIKRKAHKLSLVFFQLENQKFKHKNRHTKLFLEKVFFYVLFKWHILKRGISLILIAQKFKSGGHSHIQVKVDAVHARPTSHFVYDILKDVAREVKSAFAQRTLQLATVYKTAEVSVNVQKFVVLIVQSDKELIKFRKSDLTVFILIVLFD